ncbi:Uma2 family endonuclease [Nocardia yunnanensis]|uniref:Uma2 family endonuclease n=1 Tax=Nocardia yunnanensis TaxID=2382165 RepID=A0A386ZPP8_9NOCA|nr:Uma2 family endonuclease [Nocardia yunnanensis]AYF78679.1 Uma2 family endonuclease [Nocardia yunnanensis]
MHVPASDRWTAADLDHLPENGLRYEVLNGQLIVNAAPKPIHQRLVSALGRILEDALPDGMHMVPGVGVLIGEDEPIPDLLVCAGPISWDERGIPAGRVKLVVEVVSRSTAAMDRRIKPDLYAEGGIPDFWRIETHRLRGQLGDEELPILFAYALGRGGEYEEVARCSAGRMATLRSPFEVSFDPAVLLP